MSEQRRRHLQPAVKGFHTELKGWFVTQSEPNVMTKGYKRQELPHPHIPDVRDSGLI